MINPPKTRSLVSWLRLIVLMLIMFQTLLIAGIMTFGGVLEQAKNNAYQAFHDKVSNRTEYLQREMKNRWTNIDPYVSDIQKIITDDKTLTDTNLQKSVEPMLDMLRATQVTGVYLILDQPDKAGGRYPALYLRDYDPLANNAGLSDLYMLYGPSSVAKNLKIPLDQTWQYHMSLNVTNREFYDMPLKHAHLTQNASLLGYWSGPFRLSDNDVEIITYSRPIFDYEGNPLGIVGVEVTLNYLTQFLPSSELSPQDSLGYMIARKSFNDDSLVPVITGSALQKRLIETNKPINLKAVNEAKRIFSIEAKTKKEVIYASSQIFNLYQQNTPFINEQWYLIGFMREDQLLSYTQRIEQIIQLAIVLSVIIGGLGGLLVSMQMLKPITSLVKQVKASEVNQALQFKPTGFQELDQLAQTLETANQQMMHVASRMSRIIDITELPIGAYEINKASGGIYATDKFYEIIGCSEDETFSKMDVQKFNACMRDIMSRPEPEEMDVYRLKADQNRWVKIKVSESKRTIIGVVQDVTEELLEKRQIRRDRDLDPLTKLFNRKGFQWRFENMRQEGLQGVSALLMFDLDNLKQVNDNYGHHYGDLYIQKAVESLWSVADENHMLLGRLSGDEFVLLLHGYDSRQHIIRQVEDYFKRLNRFSIEFPDQTLKCVTISGGLKWIVDEAFTYEELLHFADEMLYDAKRHHKGYFSIAKDS